MATANSTRSSNGHSSANGKTKTRRTSAQPRMGQTAPELQRFGTLRQLPIALSAEARRRVARSST